MENEARCGHKNAVFVQDDFTKWIQSFPMKTNDTSETMSRLQRFFRHRSLEELPQTKFKSIFVKACPDCQRKQDTKHTSSLRNEQSGRAVRKSERRNSHRTRAKRTARRMVGLCDGKCYCYLRNLDKMVDGRPSRRDMAIHVTDHQFF